MEGEVLTMQITYSVELQDDGTFNVVGPDTTEACGFGSREAAQAWIAANPHGDPENVPPASTKVTVELDRRELTLIRVALLQRLDRITHMKDSYAETRELLSGKLWDASVALRDGKEG